MCSCARLVYFVLRVKELTIYYSRIACESFHSFLIELKKISAIYYPWRISVVFCPSLFLCLMMWWFFTITISLKKTTFFLISYRKDKAHSSYLTYDLVCGYWFLFILSIYVKNHIRVNRTSDFLLCVAKWNLSVSVLFYGAITIVQYYVCLTAGTNVKLATIPSNVVILNEENFNQVVLDETKDVLVEFYAPWWVFPFKILHMVSINMAVFIAISMSLHAMIISLYRCGHCKSLAPVSKSLHAQASF